MHLKTSALVEGLRAQRALEWPLSVVHAFVFRKVRVGGELFCACVALPRFDGGVYRAYVYEEVGVLRETFLALFALEGFLAGVYAHVQQQVTILSETFTAIRTHERL